MVSSQWRFQRNLWIASLLALVSGYVDVVSLLRYQAFTHLITGNAVFLGCVAMRPLSFSDDTVLGLPLQSPFFYVALWGSYALGAFAQWCCDLRWPQRGGSVAALPLAAMLMCTEVMYVVIGCDDMSCLRWTLVPLAAFSGVIAAACSIGRMGVRTTMVAGHTLTLAQLLAKLLWEHTLLREDMRKFLMSLMVIAGALGGACLGTLAFWHVHHQQGMKSNILFFPIPALLYMLMWLHDHLTPRGRVRTKRLGETTEGAGRPEASGRAETADVEAATEELHS